MGEILKKWKKERWNVNRATGDAWLIVNLLVKESITSVDYKRGCHVGWKFYIPLEWTSHTCRDFLRLAMTGREVPRKGLLSMRDDDTCVSHALAKGDNNLWHNTRFFFKEDLRSPVTSQRSIPKSLPWIFSYFLRWAIKRNVICHLQQIVYRFILNAVLECYSISLTPSLNFWNIF